MASKKDLLARADEAGVDVAKSWNKGKIEKALAKAGVSTDAKAEPASGGVEADGSGTPGVPTEPKKAGLSEEALEAHTKEAERIAASGAAGPTPKAGIPTEADRGGVTERDILVAKGKSPKVEESKTVKPPTPSLTGNSGVPTEPDRGGLSKLERKLTGVT